MVPLFQDGKLVLAGTCLFDSQDRLYLLHRIDSDHYELPGGKVEKKDLGSDSRLTLDACARAAVRELEEELGSGFTYSRLQYCGCVDFDTPNGTSAVNYVFITRILSGEPKIVELDKFHSVQPISLSELNNYRLSPNMKLIAPHLKSYLKSYLELHESSS